MRAPRVLVSGVVLGQPMGGVRRHNQELLPRLARRLREEGGGLAVLEGATPIAFDLGPDVERIASNVPAGPPLLRGLRETGALRAALAEARARARPFEVVHTGHLPVPRALGVPITLTIHDLRSMQSENTTLARRFVAAHALHDAARSVRRFLAVSASTKRDLVERIGVASDDVVLVPNAADHFEPLPRAPRDRAPILCIGHLEPRKNLALVLRALAIDPDLPPVVFAGAAKGAHAAELESLARALGVRERVTFLGPFEDRELPRLYSECAALVLPSRVEGFGIGALEAQRARAPLAIARIPALLEVAGPTTPSFDTEDAAECARALHTAIVRTERELDLDARAAERFTWEASARAWCAALHDACA